MARPAVRELPRPLPDRLVELIAGRLQVVAQPLRIRIIEYLDRGGESTVQALADELDATQQNISRHLGLLYATRVVDRRHEGRLVWYRLVDPDAFGQIERVATEIMAQLPATDPDDEVDEDPA